jgi:hypothetical protein
MKGMNRILFVGLKNLPDSARNNSSRQTSKGSANCYCQPRIGLMPGQKETEHEVWERNCLSRAWRSRTSIEVSLVG